MAKHKLIRAQNDAFKKPEVLFQMSFFHISVWIQSSQLLYRRVKCKNERMSNEVKTKWQLNPIKICRTDKVLYFIIMLHTTLSVSYVSGLNRKICIDMQKGAFLHLLALLPEQAIMIITIINCNTNTHTQTLLLFLRQ